MWTSSWKMSKMLFAHSNCLSLKLTLRCVSLISRNLYSTSLDVRFISHLIKLRINKYDDDDRLFRTITTNQQKFERSSVIKIFFQIRIFYRYKIHENDEINKLCVRKCALAFQINYEWRLIGSSLSVLLTRVLFH